MWTALIMAVTSMGLFQLIPDEEMTMMYVRNDPRFVAVSDEIIVNLGNVTKVESDSRRIWMHDQSVVGDEFVLDRLHKQIRLVSSKGK
ncbi:hypothetical protein WJ0W_005691 [Paenibacillus melissococcoides]|uniref:Uncharacterized protein n=1 Tax=Paenibacillus melissococcoides TaxID=2912268 RepID=A0ABM9G8Z0_9BACL|nr:hypothetical protein WJ0W_005691 [Paenibacillus melissococcoides]